MSTVRLLIATALVFPLVAAAVPVEDIGSGAPPVQAGAPTVSAAGQPRDAYYLLQLIREEVRQLRGLVEEQNNELAKLARKQQQDYLDLDKRLAGGVASPKAPTGTGPANSSSASISGNINEMSTGDSKSQYVQPGFSQNDQRAVYEKAYELLKARKIDQARVALNKFKDDYPTSIYTPNAQYWLGEIYLLQNELTAAEGAFRIVVEEHPGHRKVNDATFKLGKV